MKKFVLLVSVMIVLIGNARVRSFEIHRTERAIRPKNAKDVEVAECYAASHATLSDSILASWTRIFVQEGIDGNPFAMMIYLIDHFSRMDQVRHSDCISLENILKEGHTNVRSSAIATCALMRKLGWDLQCLFNDNEMYLGICFSNDWEIMEGLGTESNARMYFVKEFDTQTPAGKSKRGKIGLCQSISVSETDLAPFPLVTTLPWFSGEYSERQVKWHYEEKAYTCRIRIPEQQVEWADNLPRSLYGMAASGLLELQNIGLAEYLQEHIRGMNEFERVNFLLRFCQSDGVFYYKKDEPIKSVSRQLLEARNDCDGRGIFLYCLLRTVLDYSDDDIVFVIWSDQHHLTLAVRPRTVDALTTLTKEGYCIQDDYYVLDPAYMGDTYWGSKMEKLSDKGEIIIK